jgi:hypothetical protein
MPENAVEDAPGMTPNPTGVVCADPRRGPRRRGKETMKMRTPWLWAAFALTLTATTTGCAPRYVRGTEIEYTEERQEVADVVEQYRKAVEQRDTDALRALASRTYYENASTTDDPSDDYDYQGFQAVLGDLKESIKEIKYEIDIKAIDVIEKSAMVDYEYRGAYQFTTGEQDKWATAADKNRLTLRLEDGRWRIVSGM